MLAGEDICFGLHSTITSEWDDLRWGPVLPPEEVPSLVDEKGNFLQTTQELHERKPELEEIMEELQAQLDEARSLGFDIEYTDMHMGFHWILKELEEEFNSWCRKEGIINALNYRRSLPEVEVEGDPVEEFIARLEAAEPGQYVLVGHRDTKTRNCAPWDTTVSLGGRWSKVETGRESTSWTTG